MAPTFSLSGTTFKEQAVAPMPRRLIMGIDAEERCGKSHFALSAPGPIAYMVMGDPGASVAIAKAHTLYPKKKVVRADYVVQVKPGMDRAAVGAACNPVWMKSVQDFELILPSLGNGTLVVDTASDWFTLLKLARFGKLTQIMPEDYAPVHAEYKRLLRMTYQFNCNVIFLHKLKAEYEREKGKENQKGSGKKTGNLVRDGYSGTGYDVDMNIRLKKVDGKFVAHVLDCRQNPDLDDMEIELPERHGFAEVASLAMPDTDEKDWH